MDAAVKYRFGANPENIRSSTTMKGHTCIADAREPSKLIMPCRRRAEHVVVALTTSDTENEYEQHVDDRKHPSSHTHTVDSGVIGRNMVENATYTDEQHVDDRKHPLSHTHTVHSG